MCTRHSDIHTPRAVTIINLFLAVVALLLWLPALSDLCSAARRPFRRVRTTPPDAGTALPRLLFLLPAHDEELLIDGCLRSLLAQEYPTERLTIRVIADNCTDRTAEIARSLGVECLERADPVRRGKPWAIAWALERTSLADFDAVVVADADSMVLPRFARELAAGGPLAGKVVQPYIDVSNRTDNALTRMAHVFSAVRFRVMNPLKQSVGMNVPLGNGLCIGREILERNGWTAFSICEDWELYAIFTARGVPIEGVPDARIYSQEARSLRQSSPQRQRWTAGKLMVLRRYAWPLLRSRRIGGLQKLDTLAELTSFGPAVHLGLAAVLALAGFLLGASPWVIAALAGSLARLSLFSARALQLDPEPGQAMLSFAYLPFYTVWRLGVQVRSLSMLGDKPWVRTARHEHVVSSN
jgi:1,2-diacylglycerol 3-beta-glucosyltransferase